MATFQLIFKGIREVKYSATAPYCGQLFKERKK